VSVAVGLGTLVAVVACATGAVPVTAVVPVAVGVGQRSGGSGVEEGAHVTVGVGVVNRGSCVGVAAEIAAWVEEAGVSVADAGAVWQPIVENNSAIPRTAIQIAAMGFRAICAVISASCLWLHVRL
jgi:hypothetical protein